MPCFSWSVPQLVPLCGGCYVTVLFMRYGVIKVSQFNDICLYVWRWSSEGWFDEFFNWLCPSECLLYKILSKIWRRIQFRTERCGDLVLQVFLCISVQMNKLIVSLSLSLSLARSAWSVAPAVACQYCHNTLCCIPASSGLFRHTHTLTSSMSKLLACAYVCVHMCMRVWVCVCLCVLVPIALASCCSSSFRSSTEEMGEFLTRLTSDGGSGSPCGNHNKRTHLDLIYYIRGVILLNNLSSWFPAHKHQLCELSGWTEMKHQQESKGKRLLIVTQTKKDWFFSPGIPCRPWSSSIFYNQENSSAKAWAGDWETCLISFLNLLSTLAPVSLPPVEETMVVSGVCCRCCRSLHACLPTNTSVAQATWPLSSSLCKQQSGPQRYPPSEFLIFSIWPFGNCEICFSTFIRATQLILGCGGVKFNELLNECCRSSLWIQWGCSRENTPAVPLWRSKANVCVFAVTFHSGWL